MGLLILSSPTREAKRVNLLMPGKLFAILALELLQKSCHKYGSSPSPAHHSDTEQISSEPLPWPQDKVPLGASASQAPGPTVDSAVHEYFREFCYFVITSHKDKHMGRARFSTRAGGV